LAKYDPKDRRYHTHGLVGPDEFHEGLPGASKPGVKDNAYTNIMIVWTLLKARELLSILPEGDKAKIVKKLKLKQQDFSRWDDITQKMNIHINANGIISQFDGYFELKELDWNKYREKYGNIHRVDRILKAEGESPDDYSVTKQADVLMLFYLLEISEITSIFQRLGYRADKKNLRKNYAYYSKRTSHGSTLSKVVHCFVAHLLGGVKQSWQWFQEVLESDIYDSQGGTTPEGIHTGVMAGSIDIVMRAFVGINTLEDIIRIDPHLPDKWKRIKLRFHYKGRWISLSITKRQISIIIQGPMTRSISMPIKINNELHYLPLGKTVKFSLP
jgi:trehalose/maltose hydrolase-like predicted phosphorylase